MNRMILRLATRNSPLALWQARWVSGLLRRAHPGLRVELVPMTSSGDRDRSAALYQSTSVGVFVREIQQAVLEGRADAGVHSCKDLPTQSPDGLVFAATPGRADPRDALITADGRGLDDLPLGAVVGTSSLRRQVQLAARRPDLQFVPIRGNVDTRIAKLKRGEVQATLLAMAGLHRLGLVVASRAVPLDPWNVCVPAPAQGIVALDCRDGDRLTQHRLAAISDPEAWRAATLERAILRACEGGCSLPLGVHARRREGRWELAGALGSDIGAHPLRTVHLGGDPTTLAERAVTALKC